MIGYPPANKESSRRKPLTDKVPASNAPPPDQPTEEAKPEGASDTEPTYPSSVWEMRLNRVRLFLPKPVYMWLSARIGWRMGDEWAWANRDDEENAWIPPPEEDIRLHGVWVAEAYLPSSIRSLADGIERLGWWESHRDETIAEVIERGRSGRGGGWLNLPLIRRQTKRGRLGRRDAGRALPDGVEYATGQVHFLTPSLTVLLVGFRFDTSMSERWGAAARQPYRTYHEPLGASRARIWHPDFQRREAVRRVEREAAAGCGAWIGERMPGYFGSTGGRDGHPATTLLTTENLIPFEADDESHRWALNLGLAFAYERWETGISGLRYALRPPDGARGVLTGRRRDIFADEKYWKGWGHEDFAWSLMYRVDDLSELFALITAGEVLRDIRARLARLRDSLPGVAAKPSRAQLASARSQLGTFSSDLVAFTNEIAAWPEHPEWVLHEIPEIRAVGAAADAQPIGRRLLDWCVEDARQVREFEASTRGLLIAAAEITSALESLRTQDLVKWVSVLALLVSFAALMVSVR